MTLNSFDAWAGFSDEAIALAQAQGLLQDPELEQQLVAAQVALEDAEANDPEPLQRAIEINQALTVRFPQFFLPFFNLGTIYHSQERYQESLDAYIEALSRHPKHLDSLRNKALVLLKLDRLEEAGITYEQWRSLNPEEKIAIQDETGKFGTIEIFDDRETRSLWIDNQRQGMFYLQPTADEWEPTCRFGPGPVSSSFFTTGFLLVASLKPNGFGLVLGLGCGAGIVMSLACFPNLHLTVVEIDPAIVRMCRTFFPLVQHYIEAGRLEIVQADAQDFLRSTDRRFDFLQCDVYDGRWQLAPQFTSIEAIELMAGWCAPLLFINIMGQLNQPHLHQVLSRFDAAGKPIRMLYPLLNIKQAYKIPMNWLAFTEVAMLPDDFVPFPGLTGVGVEALDRQLNALRENAVSRETLRFYLDILNLQHLSD